ncbi:GTP-binding protein [Desulfitispora alkaliphila]|uniref:ribosome biogenesis GTP-binding protein YihA/YsxC n=1 Tax=Desulfitispora alkaliphila TaxID=622674 RepID=UPI003D1B8214
MKIHKATYELSAVNEDQYPIGDLPEIALAGRSNVGKSSLINKIINRKKLAFTSSKPGKTQTLNFYNINDKFYFVDLPGYGFAKVSKTQRGEWGKMIERYLEKREQLVGIIHIVDMRHPPSKQDVQMHQWIEHQDIPSIVVATKVDKVPRSKWHKNLKVIKQDLNLGDDVPLVSFSAETGMGVEEMSKLILQLTNQS